METKRIYRVKNWNAYNNSLIQRGSLELYIDQNALKSWKAQPEGKPGHQKEYSDVAIQTLLMIRKAFHLRLRQTQGFVKSIFKMLKIELKVPNYSIISRRSGKLNLQLPKNNKEKVYAILDSTGLKVFGEGEWKVRKHGYSKRRTWKKLHIAIDADGEIRACELTDNTIDDAEMVNSLTQEDKPIIEKFLGDGAYDKKKVYQQFDKHTLMIVPPRVDAQKGLHLYRDANISQIEQYTLENWKILTDYHKRSLVETTMFRLKTIFGDKLFAQNSDNQITKANIMCALLNKMSALGMPQSYTIT